MSNYDTLLVSQFDNDGEIFWRKVGQNYAMATLDYGTQTGGGTHTIILTPKDLKNCPHLHLKGRLDGKDLVVRLTEGNNYQQGFFPKGTYKAKSLYITAYNEITTPSTISIFWAPNTGSPILLDENSFLTDTHSSTSIEWFGDEAYGLHYTYQN